MKVKIPTKYITLGRFILTIALLAAVWTHAHWSVALSITLILIGMEINNVVFVVLIRAFKEMLEKARARNANQQTKAN